MEVEGEEHTDPAMTTSRHRLHQLRNIMEQDQDGLMTLYFTSCFISRKSYICYVMLGRYLTISQPPAC